MKSMDGFQKNNAEMINISRTKYENYRLRASVSLGLKVGGDMEVLRLA